MKHKNLFLLASLCLALLSSCSQESTPSGDSNTQSTQSTPSETPSTEQAEPEDTQEPDVAVEPQEVSVIAMNGPTGMGMVQMMKEGELGNLSNHHYDFSLITAIDEVTPQIVKGDAQFATVPANVASLLYNNTQGGVSVLAINTLGVLYLVESGESIQSIQDLAGKTIYAAGKGATPEYSLLHILKENGLEDSVTIEWKTEQAEVVATLATEPEALAMLPQPFVTTAQMNNPDLRIALDLTEEWDNLDSQGMLVTGVLLGHTEFVEAHPEVVEDFLEHYESSIVYMTENLEEGAALVGEYEIVPEAVALKALPYCSLAYLDGAEMESALSGYLEVLYEQNPDSVGGALPDSAFYYGAN